MANKIKFILNGCDISFIAEAPEDMTVKQLVEQANRIVPDWCACGICKAKDDYKVEICFDYNDVKKVDDSVACSIMEETNTKLGLEDVLFQDWIANGKGELKYDKFYEN